jgi:hypothetical protein
MVSLDGRVFDMVSSTASRVDPDAPTRFTYHEADGVLWGEYTGDTVTTGRFVGTRSEDLIDVRFVHALLAGGEPVGGAARSRIETAEDGRLRLVEDFAIDGVPHVSVCEEVRPSV